MNAKYIAENKGSLPKEASWGNCENGKFNCIHGGALGLSSYGDLNRFVGKETLNELDFGCNCKGSQNYGHFCNWNQPDENNRKFCGFCRYNIENFLSACECRDEKTNKAIPYHGWYCDILVISWWYHIHNRLLCDKSTVYHGKFYDVNAMDTDKVADCCSNVCKECDEIIKNCKECKQDADNNCKSACKNFS